MLSNRKKYETVLEDKIKKYHLIITSNLVRKNECSWFLGYFNFWLHNQTFIPMKSLDNINYPIHTAYLLWHKKYE